MDKNYTIYVDLDGVIADFNKSASNIIGRKINRNEHPITSDEWQKLVNTKNFYYNLGKTRDADELIHYLKNLILDEDFFENYKIEFLSTAPESIPKSKIDKIFWCDRYYPNIKCNIVIQKTEKSLYCEFPENDILIDDDFENIKNWKGIGVHHVNTKNTIFEIEEILNKKYY